MTPAKWLYGGVLALAFSSGLARAACAPFVFPGATVAVDDGACGIDVNWMAATGEGAITYDVYRNVGSGWAPEVVGLTTTFYHDPVVGGLSYQYYVSAIDSCAPVRQSSSNFASPVVTPACTVNEVQNVDLRCDGGVLVMTWDPLPGATGYNIYRGTLASLNATPSIYDHTDFGACNVAGTSYTLPGDCTAVAPYFFIVVGRNGTSEFDYGELDGSPIPAAVSVCP